MAGCVVLAMAKNRHKIWLIFSTVILTLALVGGTAFFFVSAKYSQNNGPLSKIVDQQGGFKDSLSALTHLNTLQKAFNDPQERSVLILFQNDTELRPSGGFITAVGEATVTAGQILDLKVSDSRDFDKNQSLEVPLPEPMQGLISTPFLTLRDANLSPDFPTSAANVLRFFIDNQDHQDGQNTQNTTDNQPEIFVAITTKFNEKLLEVIGPVTFSVNGHQINVDATNVTAELERLTDIEFATLGLNIENRKDILAAYASTVLPELTNLIKQDPLGVLALLQELVISYDLQIWSTDDEIQKHLAALNTAQIVDSNSDTDSLLIVDSNIKSRKTDPVIEQSATYTVAVQDETTSATLEITYNNRGSASTLTTTYNDYLRVFVPADSQLIEVQGLEKTSTQKQLGRTVFGGLFSVEPGQEHVVKFVYTLPAHLYASQKDEFVLDFERQPGGHIYKIKVVLNFNLGSSSHEIDSIRDRTLTIENPGPMR